RSHRTTRAPESNIRCAAASPMPPAPPVITATLPSRSIRFTTRRRSIDRALPRRHLRVRALGDAPEGALATQRGDLVRREAELGEHLFGMLAEAWRRAISGDGHPLQREWRTYRLHGFSMHVERRDRVDARELSMIR